MAGSHCKEEGAGAGPGAQLHFDVLNVYVDWLYIVVFQSKPVKQFCSCSSSVQVSQKKEGDTSTASD